MLCLSCRPAVPASRPRPNALTDEGARAQPRTRGLAKARALPKAPAIKRRQVLRPLAELFVFSDCEPCVCASSRCCRSSTASRTSMRSENHRLPAPNRPSGRALRRHGPAGQTSRTIGRSADRERGCRSRDRVSNLSPCLFWRIREPQLGKGIRGLSDRSEAPAHFPSVL